MTAEFYLPPRDYVGYGLDNPTRTWPGGKKIAVSFVLNYEEWAQSPRHGMATTANLHELYYDRPATIDGRRDALVEEMYEYGIRQGLPRLIKESRKYGWKWTTWACGRAFETTGIPSAWRTKDTRLHVTATVGLHSRLSG